MNLDGSVMWGPTTKPFPATITPITFWVWCYLKCCSVRSVSRCKPDQASPALPPIMDQSDWIIHWPTERLNDPFSHPALIFFPLWTLIIWWIRSPVCDVDFSEAFWMVVLTFLSILLVRSSRISGVLVKSCCGLVWLLWSDHFSSSGRIVYLFLTMWEKYCYFG